MIDVEIMITRVIDGLCVYVCKVTVVYQDELRVGVKLGENCDQ